MSETHRSPNQEPHRITHESIDLSQGPVRLALGQKQEVRVLSTERDLRWSGAWQVPYIVVDPETFSEETNHPTGYKGLRDGESVVLGRDHDHGRFNFKPGVSREHVNLIVRDDELIVSDLDSLNGTWKIEDQVPKKEDKPTPTRTQAEHKIAKPEQVGGYSLASERHPERNEDAFFVDGENPALGVFDGLGGITGSEQASAIAADVVSSSLSELDPKQTRGNSRMAMFEAIWNAHEAIVKASEIQGEQFATTATAVKLFHTEHGTPYAVVATAGDSRAYLYRDGRLEHLTLDQAILPGTKDGKDNESTQKIMQMKLAEISDESEMDDEARKIFGMRNIITSSLGLKSSPPEINLADFEVMPGDKLVVTTDGVHDNLTNSEIEQIIGNNEDAQSIVELLSHAAQSRSRDGSHLRAKPDDITAVALAL